MTKVEFKNWSEKRWNFIVTMCGKRVQEGLAEGMTPVDLASQMTQEGYPPYQGNHIHPRDICKIAELMASQSTEYGQ